MKCFRTSFRVLVMACLIMGINKCLAISSNFQNLIDTIGIPRYNVYGQEINEDVYLAYNILSYGTPESLEGNKDQRWKDSKYGLWSRYTGKYNGSGIRRRI